MSPSILLSWRPVRIDNPRALSDPAVAPDLYSTHADTIESALAHICRARRLAPDHADEFCSWARIRLIDNDQAILRKFEGRSSLRTFLITVTQRLFLDWRNAEWGKWRPTADARRLGQVAIELERLVLRDRLAYAEAVQILVGRGLTTADECEHTWSQLPRRPQRQRVTEDDITDLPSPSTASAALEASEADREAARMCAALTRALQVLAPADRLLLQMRYWSGQTVARIATTTGAEQKALYRKFERLAVELRRLLEAEGIDGKALHVLTGRFDLSDAEPAGATGPTGMDTPGPSPFSSTGRSHV